MTPANIQYLPTYEPQLARFASIVVPVRPPFDRNHGILAYNPTIWEKLIENSLLFYKEYWSRFDGIVLSIIAYRLWINWRILVSNIPISNDKDDKNIPLYNERFQKAENYQPGARFSGLIGILLLIGLSYVNILLIAVVVLVLIAMVL